MPIEGIECVCDETRDTNNNIECYNECMHLPLDLLAKSIVGHIRFDLAQAKVTQEKCVHGCTDETHYEENTVHVACDIVSCTPQRLWGICWR
jgi:hypothetical protein